MKMINKKKVAMTSFLLSLCFTLFSFSISKGGEGFEIYLNSKLVLQQFGSQMNTVKSISLDQSLSASELNISYYHCGRAGKNRSVTIRDTNNKILKEWRFADASTSSLTISGSAMSCKVSDILGLQKKNPGKLDLYYSSSELPKGRLLATLIFSSDNVARR